MVLSHRWIPFKERKVVCLASGEAYATAGVLPHLYNEQSSCTAAPAMPSDRLLVPWWPRRSSSTTLHAQMTGQSCGLSGAITSTVLSTWPRTERPRRPGDGRAVHDAPRCWQPQDRHVCNKSPYAFVGSGPRPCSHDILFGGQPWHNQSTSPSHDVDPHSEDGPVATIMLKYK
jgi:hypothetical protein